MDTGENIQETVDAIKLMIVGSLLAEYGARLIVDDTKRDLKYRVKCVINAVKNIEMHFLNHDRTVSSSRFRESFKREFNKNETVLLADLNLTCWGIGEDGLEEIINAVKQAITESPNQ
jgi:hypothetical protein